MKAIKILTGIILSSVVFAACAADIGHNNASQSVNFTIDANLRAITPFIKIAHVHMIPRRFYTVCCSGYPEVNGRIRYFKVNKQDFKPKILFGRVTACARIERSSILVFTGVWIAAAAHQMIQCQVR